MPCACAQAGIAVVFNAPRPAWIPLSGIDRELRLYVPAGQRAAKQIRHASSRRLDTDASQPPTRAANALPVLAATQDQ
ncbi:hypothetical protein Xcc1_15220 [Xanthomonas campestris pv. campestris]|nr:hypothetical protein Xcc1_15220 [Xanthomonas campestris pv. campestris]